MGQFRCFVKSSQDIKGEEENNFGAEQGCLGCLLWLPFLQRRCLGKSFRNIFFWVFSMFLHPCRVSNCKRIHLKKLGRTGVTKVDGLRTLVSSDCLQLNTQNQINPKKTCGQTNTLPNYRKKHAPPTYSSLRNPGSTSGSSRPSDAHLVLSARRADSFFFAEEIEKDKNFQKGRSRSASSQESFAFVHLHLFSADHRS